MWYQRNVGVLTEIEETRKSVADDMRVLRKTNRNRDYLTKEERRTLNRARLKELKKSRGWTVMRVTGPQQLLDKAIEFNIRSRSDSARYHETEEYWLKLSHRFLNAAGWMAEQQNITLKTVKVNDE